MYLINGVLKVDAADHMAARQRAICTFHVVVKSVRKINAPGSQEAVERGCSCPQIDNHYGEGRQNPDDFIKHTGCRVHG